VNSEEEAAEEHPEEEVREEHPEEEDSEAAEGSEEASANKTDTDPKTEADSIALMKPLPEAIEEEEPPEEEDLKKHI
jgi:hypothetical protein